MFGNAFKKIFVVLFLLALLLGLGAGVLFGVIPALRYDVWRVEPDEQVSVADTPVAETTPQATEAATAEPTATPLCPVGSMWIRAEAAPPSRSVIRSVLAWPASALPLPGLDDALRDTGFHLVEADRQDGSATKTNWSIGLTGADAGLAATGSLVFAPAPGHSWLPALLPARHIVILPSDRLYPDLAAWREAWRQGGREQDAAGALIITGPSISADIEFHRHRGTFGPRFLHLILIDSGGGP